MGSSEKQEIMKSSHTLAVNYIKKHYDADFVIKEYHFVDSYIDTTVYLHGYIKGYEDIVISVAYNFKSKEISDVAGPDWFIDSRKP